jgi:hypothetical protein
MGREARVKREEPKSPRRIRLEPKIWTRADVHRVLFPKPASDDVSIDMETTSPEVEFLPAAEDPA